MATLRGTERRSAGSALLRSAPVERTQPDQKDGAENLLSWKYCNAIATAICIDATATTETLEVLGADPTT
eukprot:3005945-Amphidinium_carterae.1